MIQLQSPFCLGRFDCAQNICNLIVTIYRHYIHVILLYNIMTSQIVFKTFLTLILNTASVLFDLIYICIHLCLRSKDLLKFCILMYHIRKKVIFVDHLLLLVRSKKNKKSDCSPLLEFFFVILTVLGHLMFLNVKHPSLLSFTLGIFFV